MASMVYQLFKQVKSTGRAKLFGGSDGYDDGEQRRDFVYVGDAVQINLFFAKRHEITRGIFNVGTGTSRTFNDVARAVICNLGSGKIDYVPFPSELKGKYQSFTEADLAELRAASWNARFTSIEDGVAQSAAEWVNED
jgi:ADP-L-glycero-D-manno-heptose 6-epimerase